MKTCLVLAACVAFLLLAGCQRCGMWDWYKPCDLIEGRAERECGPCAMPCYQPGQVVRREYAVRATPCAPAATDVPAAPVAPVAPAPLPPPAVAPPPAQP